eukprot:GHVN01043803.1.p1 GENE.GHVN01043803.1~~GHVN01043803.1.p1  ORF type:complete len:156 (+),score=8.52 GHVN01043803.1:1099-1566(+)
MQHADALSRAAVFFVHRQKKVAMPSLGNVRAAQLEVSAAERQSEEYVEVDGTIYKIETRELRAVGLLVVIITEQARSFTQARQELPELSLTVFTGLVKNDAKAFYDGCEVCVRVSAFIMGRCAPFLSAGGLPYSGGGHLWPGLSNNGRAVCDRFH